MLVLEHLSALVLNANLVIAVFSIIFSFIVSFFLPFLLLDSPLGLPVTLHSDILSTCAMCSVLPLVIDCRRHIHLILNFALNIYGLHAWWWFSTCSFLSHRKN